LFYNFGCNINVSIIIEHLFWGFDFTLIKIIIIMSFHTMGAENKKADWAVFRLQRGTLSIKWDSDCKERVGTWICKSSDKC